MFTVTGRLADGKPYDVRVDDLSPPGHWGIVKGTSDALVLLAGYEGRTVAASPVGPFYTLASGDPVSILAALAQHTEILATSGDVPNIAGEVPHRSVS